MPDKYSNFSEHAAAEPPLWVRCGQLLRTVDSWSESIRVRICKAATLEISATSGVLARACRLSYPGGCGAHFLHH
jgi:hypothetical protein